jgi:heme A synthase
MNILFHAHSGLRYLVLLAGVAAIVTLALGYARGRAYAGPSRGVTAAFTGLLHLQVLLGIALVLMGIWYGALMGHLTMMIVAAILMPALSAYAKKQPDGKKAHGVALAGVVLTLLLIVGGIMSIRSSPFASSGRPAAVAPR